MESIISSCFGLKESYPQYRFRIVYLSLILLVSPYERYIALNLADGVGAGSAVAEHIDVGALRQRLTVVGAIPFKGWVVRVEDEGTHAVVDIDVEVVVVVDGVEPEHTVLVLGARGEEVG